MSTLHQSKDLFGNSTITCPKTEGIKYAGSKLKLLPHILALASEVQAKSVFDGFAGTTRVSQAFAQSGYDVTSADISVWSETFANCYLKGSHASKYHNLIEHLNSVKPFDGWFTHNYGGGADTQSRDKRPWQYHNTRKLDGIRAEIDRLGLDKVEKSVALTSLIQALDRVDSTMGHFTSYLKDWSSRSNNKLHLRVPQIIENGRVENHEVRRGDVFDTIKSVSTDLAYLDPPYGSNNEKMPPSRVRYASYYHVWTTIILNDEPEIFGAANRRVDSRDKVAASIFEEFRKDVDGNFIAVSAIQRLLREVKAKHVILSYSSGGRATAGNLREAISSVGRVVTVKEVDYKKNVMAGMRWTDEWIPAVDTKNIEYLFLIEKS
mgnify:CR=1 FL=1